MNQIVISVATLGADDLVPIITTDMKHSTRKKPLKNLKLGDDGCVLCKSCLICDYPLGASDRCADKTHTQGSTGQFTRWAKR